MFPLLKVKGMKNIFAVEYCIWIWSASSHLELFLWPEDAGIYIAGSIP